MHRFVEFLRKVLPRPPSLEAEQRLPQVEQRPKIETVELADMPRQPPVAITSYEVTKRRAISDSAVVETSESDVSTAALSLLARRFDTS